MSFHGVKIQRPSNTAPRISGRLLQRKCACGKHTVSGKDCDACRKKQIGLQRSAAGFRSDVGRHAAAPPLNARNGSLADSCFACNISRVPVRGEEASRVLPKLSIGQANDVYEQEADRTADLLVRMPEPQQKLPGPEGFSVEPPTQRLDRNSPSAGSPGLAVAPEVESQIHGLQGGGNPLPETVRSFFEPRFGHNFSDVRIHTGQRATAAANAVNAQAFTLDSDIVFGSNQYAPQTSHGKHLLAHELTHVVQQDAAPQGLAQGQAKTIQRDALEDAERIDSLLSYGIFDWAITDAEAIEALEILSNLPSSLQASVLQRINIGRLRDNLPKTHHPILDQIITAAGGMPPSDIQTTVERINNLLSYGIFDWAITDADATEAFELLTAQTPTEQQKMVLVIDHQRLYDNLPEEKQKKELDAIRKPALTHETTELATMKGHRTRGKKIVEDIKRKADALTLPAPPADGKFEKWLTSTYLTEYCKKPGSATAKPAIERMTEEGAGGFSHYGYGLLRGLATEASHDGIGFIDSPYFLGSPAPGSVTAAGFFDPWSQGPNPTDLMHFAAGLEWAWAPAAIIQWYFVHYEKTTEEGWQLFGLDALNDVIAEEGGRLLAIDMQAGTLSCPSSGTADLDPYFMKGRRFLKGELSENKLNSLAMRVHQPVMVVDTGAGGTHSKALWNRTIMEQVMGGASDASILASPDAKILTTLYHLLRKG